MDAESPLEKIGKELEEGKSGWAEKIIERRKEILSKAKKLQELVFSENFKVNKVVSQSYATQIMPLSEIVIGRRCSGYNGGYRQEITLDVVPEDESLPICKINFNGESTAKGGDRIKVKIPRYAKVRTLSILSLNEDVYLDRPYKTEETAIEIDILDEHNRVLRCDRSVEYDKFCKE